MFDFLKKNKDEDKENTYELQNDEVEVKITYECIGKDKNGKKVSRVVYHNAPKNYQLVKVIENRDIAILKDLDYVVPD